MKSWMPVKWIPVSERLPANQQEVLIGWDKPRHNWPTGPRVMSATFRDFSEYNDEDGSRLFRTGDSAYVVGELHCPSHWAELPEPPA